MVYNKVGQIRQNPDQSDNFDLAQNSYFSPISYSNIIIQTQSPYDDTKKFNDFGLSIYEEIDNTRRQITFDKQNTYQDNEAKGKHLQHVRLDNGCFRHDCNVGIQSWQIV